MGLIRGKANIVSKRNIVNFDENVVRAIASTAGLANTTSQLLPEKVIYVSPNFPNVFPKYSVISLALEAAAENDNYLIYVHAGEYSETMTLKNGVNMYFEPNTSLVPVISSNSTIITADDVTAGLYGYLNVIAVNDGYDVKVIGVTNDSEVNIELNNVTCPTDACTIYVASGSDANIKLNYSDAKLVNYGFTTFTADFIDAIQVSSGTFKAKIRELNYFKQLDGTTYLDFVESYQSGTRQWEMTGGSLLLQNGIIYNDDVSQNISQSGGTVMLDHIRIKNTGHDNYRISGDTPVLIINVAVFVSGVLSKNLVSSSGSGSSVRVYLGYGNTGEDAFINYDIGALAVASNVTLI